MPGTPSKGQQFEARVARLLYAEGAFVRRAVDLNTRFREPSQVTDIDVLAFFFDRTLQVRIVNGECKTTESKSAPSSADRLLWLTGITKLIDSDDSFLATTKRVSDHVRDLATQLGAEVLDTRDISHREKLLGLSDESPFGVQAPELHLPSTDVLATIKSDSELRRVYTFVRSELWLAPPIAALKRSIAACRVLSGRYSDNLPERERSAVTRLVAEIITGITLALTRIANLAYRQPEDVFDNFFHERLAEGAASYGAMQEMSKTIEKYMVGMLSELNVDPARAAGVIGAFDPRPPVYAESLTEVVKRLAMSAAAAADLPRLADHYLLSAVHPPVASAPVPATDEQETSRLLRLVAAFLEGQIEFPAALLRPLRTNGPGLGASPTPASDADDQAGGREQHHASSPGRLLDVSPQ